MAVHTNNQRDYDKAITFYKEALVYNENDGKVCIVLTLPTLSSVHPLSNIVSYYHGISIINTEKIYEILQYKNISTDKY